MMVNYSLRQQEIQAACRYLDSKKKQREERWMDRATTCGLAVAGLLLFLILQVLS
jgi:hypothetical protein